MFPLRNPVNPPSRLNLCAGLALVIASRLFAFWLFPLCSEDFFISAHASLDPAWHAATTSPLWSLACAWGDPPSIARLLSLVADCGAVWASWRVLGLWGFWAFVGLWITPFFVGSAVSGLETHVAACAMLMARIWPAGYFLAAALRPDTALISLAASGKRWRWAAAGALLCLALSFAYSGHWLLQTITSKAAVYGIHPGAWGWLMPRELDGIAVAILAGAVLAFRVQREGDRRPWLYAGAAVAFLLGHVAIGTPIFHWYAVMPFAMLGLIACQSIRRPWHLALAFAVMLLFAGRQWHALSDRQEREARLWFAGSEIAKLHPQGTILLEPAGMIPYQNRQLRIVDDVGLLEPWMAWRRAQGPGWRTDAIAKYHPQWIVMRMREYSFPETWTVGTPGYYDSTDAKPKGYGIVLLPGVTKIGDTGLVKMRLISSNLVVLMKRPK